MIKLKITAVLALMLTFVTGLSAPAYADPDILVTPLEYDFGEVELGDSCITTITIDNFNGHPLVITEVSMVAGSSGDIFIVSELQFPIVLDSDDLLLVDVVFSPSSEGFAAANMGIFSNDPDEALVVVEFRGVGISASWKPITIEDIIDFFEAGVEAGTIEEQGKRHRMKKLRLIAMMKLLEVAACLIEADLIEEACFILERAYLRSDGHKWPRDFVVGDDCPELNAMILQLIVDLCDEGGMT